MHEWSEPRPGHVDRLSYLIKVVKWRFQTPGDGQSLCIGINGVDLTEEGPG